MVNYDITFTINAASLSKDEYYQYMKNTIWSIMQKYNYGRCRYTFILYGTAAVQYYTFDHVFPNLELLLRAFNRIPKVTGGVGIFQAINTAKSNFQSNSREDSWKVLVVMSDTKLNLPKSIFQTMFGPLEAMGVLIMPVGMGRLINPLEFYYMSTYRDTVLFAADYRFTSYLRFGELVMSTMTRCKYLYKQL